MAIHDGGVYLELANQLGVRNWQGRRKVANTITGQGHVFHVGRAAAIARTNHHPPLYYFFAIP